MKEALHKRLLNSRTKKKKPAKINQLACLTIFCNNPHEVPVETNRAYCTEFAVTKVTKHCLFVSNFKTKKKSLLW